MSTLLITHALIVNEGTCSPGSVLIQDDCIARIIPENSPLPQSAGQVIDAGGNYLMPGVIDDQVHFREPGLTHKGDIFTETRAAAAGGVTSFMDMPNTNPQTVTIDELNTKYRLGSEKSLINYSFLIGATNDNLGEIMKADPMSVPGIKI